MALSSIMPTVDLDNFIRRLERLPSILKTVVEEENEYPLRVMVDVAKAQHKFTNRTGRLESAIKSRKSSGGAEAYLDTGVAKYAGYIHEGTKYIEADPFLTAAADDAQVDRAIDMMLSAVVEQSMGLI